MISDAAIAQIVILITTLASLGFQIYRENRQRKWSLEDREHAEQSRKVIRKKLDEQRIAIDENTEISRAAFDQANHVNEKIARIGGEILNERRRPVVVQNVTVSGHEVGHSVVGPDDPCDDETAALPKAAGEK